MAGGSRKLAGYMSRQAARLASRVVIRDYREFCIGGPHKRALLSYLVPPLIPPPRLRDQAMFSNRGIAQEIPRVLNELGYSVDIVNYDNVSWRPSGPYDLFIGHGGYNFVGLSRAVGDDALRIYFATGIYWKTANMRLAARLLAVAQRTGHLLPGRRAVEQDEEGAQLEADKVICLGGESAAATFGIGEKAIGINNAVFPLVGLQTKNGDYSVKRRGFLFFSGWGNVLKGLDLLIEAFSGIDLELHVCQRMEEDFERVYGPSIKGAGNIYVHGFTRMRSRRFTELAGRCAWVISATCSEGQPGSVLECMAHGLVPILPDEANIDVTDSGIRLDSCEPVAIRAAVLRAASLPEQDYMALRSRTMMEVQAKYSPTTFRTALKDAILTFTRTRVGALLRGNV